MAHALPHGAPHLDQLAGDAAPGDVQAARRRTEIHAPIRLLWVPVTAFTHRTAVSLGMKLGLAHARSMGGFSRRVAQTTTLRADFETTVRRLQDEAWRFDTAVQNK